MATPLSGKLKETPLSDVLELLRTRKATGMLAVRGNDVTKSIYIRDGQIVFAASSDARDRLGETLVKSGLITREHLEQALELLKKSGGLKKLGAVLVENGLIPPKELFNGLKIQVKEIIFSLFLWDEGEFQFKEGLPSDIIQLQIDFQELIAEIIKRIRQEA